MKGIMTMLMEREQHRASCKSCTAGGAVNHGRNTPEVYTDGVHLWSPDVEDLHRFASSIGLKREWFQQINTRFRGRGPVISLNHYDLTTNGAYHRAILKGAVEIHWREFGRFIRRFPEYWQQKGVEQPSEYKAS